MTSVCPYWAWTMQISTWSTGPFRVNEKKPGRHWNIYMNKKGSGRLGWPIIMQPFLDELAGYAHIAPMVNQVEFSPFLQPAGLLDRCKKDNILLQAYTPLIRGKKWMIRGCSIIRKIWQNTGTGDPALGYSERCLPDTKIGYACPAGREY